MAAKTYRCKYQGFVYVRGQDGVVPGLSKVREAYALVGTFSVSCAVLTIPPPIHIDFIPFLLPTATSSSYLNSLYALLSHYLAKILIYVLLYN